MLSSRVRLNRAAKSTAVLSISLCLIAAGCAPSVQLAETPNVRSSEWQLSYAPLDVPLDQPQGWEAFGNSQLADLLDRARAANSDIAIAAARIKLARAELGIAKAANGPEIGISGRADSNVRGGSGVSSFRDSYVTGDINISYDLDLFGRLKARKRSAWSRLVAAGHERDAVQLAIESEVIRNFVEYATLSDRIALAQSGLDNARDLQRIINIRAREGVADQVDVGLQTTEANAIAIDLSRLVESRANVGNALSILVGEEASNFALAQTSVDQFHIPQFAVVQPGQLLVRRPDLLAAEALIEAANGDVQEARAAFLPSLSISAGSFVDSAASGGILSVGFAAGAQLLGTIFDNGRRKNAVYRASAEQEITVEQFRQTLLRALSETQNALIAADQTRQRTLLLTSSLQFASRTAELARTRYFEGDTNLGTVLDADRRLLEVQESLAIAKQEQINAAISLYRAMGGTPHKI